jgi:hypothetical protein
MSPPLDLLRRLCSQGVHLSAEPSGWDFGVGVRFWRVEASALVLQVGVPLEAGRVPPGTGLWCVYEAHGRVRTFRTVLREEILRPDGRLAAWSVDLPAAIGSEDRRRAFRVPTIVGARFELRLEDRLWPVKCRNLSVLGALLELPEPVQDALPHDGRYRLHIDTHEGEVTVAARIARRRGDTFAVRFPSSVRLGEVQPPPDLARVVRVLELRWLRKRSGQKVA